MLASGQTVLKHEGGCNAGTDADSVKIARPFSKEKRSHNT